MNPIVPFVLHLLAAAKRSVTAEDVAFLMTRDPRPCHVATAKHALDLAFVKGLVARDVEKRYWLTPAGSDCAVSITTADPTPDLPMSDVSC